MMDTNLFKIPAVTGQVFTSEALGRVVSSKDVDGLNKSERRALYMELARALYAVNSEIELAVWREKLPENHMNHRKSDSEWLNKARIMRKMTMCFMSTIKEYERGLPENPLEEEARKVMAKDRRRIRRKQMIFDSFYQLVEAEIGEEKASELATHARRIADAQVDNDNTGWSAEDQTPIREEMEY